MKKLLLATLCTALIFGVFAFPRPAKALFPTHDYIRDAFKILVRFAVKKALETVVSQIHDIILNPGGGNVGPAYIINWRSYLRDVEMEGLDIAQQGAGLAIYGVGGDANQATVCDYLRQQVGYAVGAKQVSPEMVARLQKYQKGNVDFKSQVQCSAPKTVAKSDGTTAPFDIQRYMNGEPDYFTWENFSKLNDEQNRLIPLALMTNEEYTRQITEQKSAKTSQGIADQGFKPLVNAADIIKSPGSYVKNAATSVIDTELKCIANVNIDDSPASIAGLASCLMEGLTSSLKNFGGIDLKDKPTPTPYDPNQWSQATCNDYCNAIASSQCEGGVVLNIAQCKQSVRFQCFREHLSNGCKL